MPFKSPLNLAVFAVSIFMMNIITITSCYNLSLLFARLLPFMQESLVILITVPALTPTYIFKVVTNAELVKFKALLKVKESHSMYFKV